jgi:activating signal cointegrator 1
VKALSILQPLASLIAIRTNRYERRSWPTSYRGAIAIHASKRLGPHEREFCQHPLVAPAYRRAGLIDPARQLPRGDIVATARLVAGHRTESIRDRLTEEERTLGFYDNGRFAWDLGDVVPITQPVPAAGMLGVWEWDH